MKGLGSADWKFNLEQPGRREENGFELPFHSFTHFTQPPQPLIASTCGLDRISHMEWKGPTDNKWVSGEVKKRREEGSGHLQGVIRGLLPVWRLSRLGFPCSSREEH